MEQVKIQRRFAPQIAEKLETIDETELAALLGLKEPSKASKWARMIDRIERDPTVNSAEFQKAWRKLKQDINESSGLEFRHDRES